MERIAVAVVQDYESEPRLRCVIRNRLDAIKDLFDALDTGYSQVNSCYEAGACGFELYRRITDLAALCVVVAPASVPKKANDRIKTDHRDAMKLALGLRSGVAFTVLQRARQEAA